MVDSLTEEEFNNKQTQVEEKDEYDRIAYNYSVLEEILNPVSRSLLSAKSYMRRTNMNDDFDDYEIKDGIYNIEKDVSSLLKKVANRIDYGVRREEYFDISEINED